MPTRYLKVDQLEVIDEMEVTNKKPYNWLKLIVIKLPVAFGGGFAFIVPALGSVGWNLGSPELAISEGAKLIAGIVLVLISLFI